MFNSFIKKEPNCNNHHHRDKTNHHANLKGPESLKEITRIA